MSPSESESDRPQPPSVAGSRSAACELDDEYRIREFTPAFAALLGRSPKELIGRSVTEFFAPQDRLELQRLLAQHAGGLGRGRVLRLDRPEDDPRWVSVCVCPRSLDGDGGVILHVLDRTEHEIARRARTRRERQQAALARIAESITRLGRCESYLQEVARAVAEGVEGAFSAIYRHDKGTRRLERVAGVGWTLNGSGHTFFLETESDSPEATCLRLQAPVVSTCTGDEPNRTLETHDPRYGVTSCVCAPIFDVERSWGVLAVYGVESGPESSSNAETFLRSVAALLGVALEREAAEQRLKEREREFDELLEYAADGIVRLQTDGTISALNAQAARLGGLATQTAVGRHVASLPLFAGDSAEAVHEALRQTASGAVPEPVTARIEDKTEPDGERVVEARFRLVRRSGRPHAVLCTLRDLTDLHRLQRQLYAAQRMEGIGRLAGGIAHDFNNVLSVIMSLGSFLRDGASEENTQKDLDVILDAAQRGANLVSQLLAFSRRKATRPQRVRVEKTLRALEPMLSRIVGEHVALSIHHEGKIEPIWIEPTQLEQVIVNLVVNARDAMPRGGNLTIETRTVELDAAYVRTHRPARTGCYTVLVVTDTGSGMPPEVLERVFEPFFTTKERGVGTGLGLATCYGIVKQAGGFIWAYSELEHGSCFKVYLPVAAERTGGDVVNPATRESTPKQYGRGETILLVEDDPFVRGVTARVLEHAGYRVLVAGSGHEALALARKHRQQTIDLVLTDVVMPGMDGRRFAQTFAQEHPNVPVLYMSGYTENAIVHHGVLEPGLHVINKPFTPEALTRTVRRLLDAAQGER